MFDKDNYWRYRKSGRSWPVKRKPVVTPKGSPVEYTTREGVEALYPNDEGGHMVRIKGKLTMLNRKEYRRRSVSRLFTKPVPKGFHAVNAPRQDYFRRDGLTNHQRVVMQRSTQYGDGKSRMVLK